MKYQDTLIEQSLQNPNRQLVQSCIPNLEGSNLLCYKMLLLINTDTKIQLYIAMNKEAQIISINTDPLALVSDQ